uniref:Uncharacterized protein n=1 Tax=Tetraselmis sp. GSL018 TaxID=582737 RepID=A0A061SF64_9CHLO|mmetsp:Transcript_8635/g.20792  ORF Transcript_8635/g.20792 Transcript_8635/m.20792 type:complete len:263 (-) Transcript_8635:269-1057(-)
MTGVKTRAQLKASQNSHEERTKAIGKRPKNSDDFDNCESVRKKQFTKSGKSRDKGRVEGETCKNQLNLRPPPGSKEKSGNCRTLKINRSPVMKIWAATLAERTSFSWAEGLSLGGTVAGLNAQTKGRSIGIYKQREDKSEEKEEKRKSRAETETVQLLGRRIPVVRTNDGRVLGKAPKGGPLPPESVHRSLVKAFSEAGYGDVFAAMRDLAATVEPGSARGPLGYQLYERFRPSVPPGRAGWGRAGALDLGLIRRMASERRR